MTDGKKDVVSAFIKARDDLYKHLGFEENWTMYPLDFGTIEAFWYVKNDIITWRTWDLEPEDYYSAKVFKHRFYPNGSIFRGAEFTMIFGKPGVDGMIWAYVFRNENEAGTEACLSPKVSGINK